MDADKFQLITEADFVLSKCGRFVPPVGSVVYIPKSFLLQAVLPGTSTQTFYTEITGDTTWCWRSIAVSLSGSPPLVEAQILKPDGHFLFSGLLDLVELQGFGSFRYLLSRELEIPPGSKIMLTLDDNYLAAGVVQPMLMLCGGAYAYYLKGGIRPKWNSGIWSYEQEASALPRIFAGPNQNLLAPCWMAGVGPRVPSGIKADCYTLGDGVTNVATVTVGSNQSAHCSIQIDADSDFHVRRLFFDPTKTGDVTAGTWLGRIRASSGYAFTDDYVELVRYLGSAPLAKGWDVKRGDQILFDLLYVDAAGSGTVTLTCFADGEKRRAA